MRRKLVILFVGLATITGGFVFWQGNRRSGQSQANPQVMASLPLLKNMVTVIAGDTLKVDSIIKGAGCNHEYEPSSQDLRRVAGSGIYIKAGLGFDIWADKLVRTALGKEAAVIDASRGIRALEEPAEVAGHPHEEEHETTGEAEHYRTGPEAHHHHELGNPHYWGDPDNVKQAAATILAALLEKMPERNREYTQNYRNFVDKLDALTAELKTRVARLPDKRIVSYSAAFPYFYQYFGFENLATVETTCEQEISPKRLAEVAQLMKTKGVRVLVGEAVYPKAPENLAQESGAKLVLLWPGTNDSGDYLASIRENVEKMVAALK